MGILSWFRSLRSSDVPDEWSSDVPDEWSSDVPDESRSLLRYRYEDPAFEETEEAGSS